MARQLRRSAQAEPVRNAPACEALSAAAVQPRRFDAVLMDCQMPVMDDEGHTAIVHTNDVPLKPIIGISGYHTLGVSRAAFQKLHGIAMPYR